MDVRLPLNGIFFNITGKLLHLWFSEMINGITSLHFYVEIQLSNEMLNRFKKMQESESTGLFFQQKWASPNNTKPFNNTTLVCPDICGHCK